MKIQISKTKYKPVTLTDEHIKEVAKYYLLRKYKLTDRYIDNKGDLIESEEHHTSHSYFTDTVVRKATDKDRILLEVIKEIK